MAHERFYAICEDKCQVEITDMVVKRRFTISIDRIGGGASVSVQKNLSEYGITDNQNVTALITVTSGLYPSLIWATNITAAGVFECSCTNTAGNAITGITANVTII